MKLSEMNTEQLMGALIRLAKPLEAIASDNRVYELIDSYRKRAKETRVPVIASMEMFSKLIPLLLESHKAETVAILTEVTGRPVGQVAKMNGFQLALEASHAWRKEIGPFFTQFMRGELIE